jgi:Cu-processing system ATP-binding protein
MIHIENIYKSYRKKEILKGVSASFEKRQVVALIGPNGSGKTTLIKCILGLVKPSAGTITLNGEVLGEDPGYRRQIGYMPQIGRYPDNMKVEELFSLLQSTRQALNSQMDKELLQQLNIAAFSHQPMRTLSGGSRQKVSAAAAFLFHPQVLILDEPTAGLDPLSAEILKEKIIKERKQNKLILLTSHILSDLDELATHILYLQEGVPLFFKPIEDLREETGQAQLGKAIAAIMRGQQREEAFKKTGTTG